MSNFNTLEIVVILLLMVIGTVTINTFLVFFLWNWLAPILFTLPKITFLQTIGLVVLCSCLFKAQTYNIK